MATTGAKFPTATAAVSENPWDDNNWAGGVVSQLTADDTDYANITSSTFDTGLRSWVAKVYTFDFSAVPDGATIDGVIVKVNARYANGTASIDLCQLLDANGAKVGTNLADTPVALTGTLADHTFGASDNVWGNTLTSAWVKDADFGVAIGFIATGDDADVYADYVTMEVYYTEVVDPDVTVPITEVFGAADQLAPVIMGAALYAPDHIDQALELIDPTLATTQNLGVGNYRSTTVRMDF
jgi:hypothetical protein